MAGNQVKIQELKNGQLVMTIPKPLANMKGWKKGTVLEFVEDRFGSLILREVKT